MTSTPGAPLCDPLAMNRFHRIFREALEAAPGFVGGVAAGDEGRAEFVGSYYDNVLRLLHAHHEGEDLTIYPWMVERLPDHLEAINRVNDEHESMLGSLGAAENAVATWRAEPSSTNREAAVAALDDLGRVLLAHLDHEEAEIVPLIGMCITAPEWGILSSTAFQHFTGDKPWLAIGLIQEQMLPHEVEMMDTNMPPPVQEFWSTSGHSMFDRYVAELRG
ncbi:MAG TPA: hemerythrin domain-containing protein [Marmoricola sp.]|nr:hemerythrin domain-containing protein [Marmoricola sp.]